MNTIKGLLEKYKKIEGERFFGEIFNENEYQAVKEVYNTVLDVGACAGEFCAYIYDLSKTIYAIEPYSAHFKELEENIKEFELAKIKPFRLALSDKNGTGKLMVGDRGSHLLGTEGEETEIKTLATFMRENKIDHIDLLKIDIEGGEDKVFNSDDFWNVVDKIDCIIGEHLGNVKGILEFYGFKSSMDKNQYIFKR